jgi:hypothetical protein
MFWENWGLQKLSNQFLVLCQSQTKTLIKTHLAKSSNKYPKDCLLVQNLHTTKTKKNKKVFIGCKVWPKAHYHQYPKKGAGTLFCAANKKVCCSTKKIVLAHALQRKCSGTKKGGR